MGSRLQGVAAPLYNGRAPALRAQHHQTVARAGLRLGLLEPEVAPLGDGASIVERIVGHIVERIAATTRTTLIVKLIVEYIRAATFMPPAAPSPAPKPYEL